MRAMNWSWFSAVPSQKCKRWSSCRSFGVVGCVFALYRLHHRRRSGFSFLHLDGQVTQHGIIEFECGFQLDQGLVVAFDVQADVVSFRQFWIE
jgi:hypothetical protein